MGFSNWINCNSFAGSQKVNYIIFPWSLHRICFYSVRRNSTASEKCSGWIQQFCSELPTFCEELLFKYLSILENNRRYPSWVGNKQISGVYSWRQCHLSVADIGVTDRDILCKCHWCYIGMFLVCPQKIINHITAACETCASFRVSHDALFWGSEAFLINESV